MYRAWYNLNTQDNVTNKQAVRSLDEELRFSKSEITLNHLFTYAYFVILSYLAKVQILRLEFCITFIFFSKNKFYKDFGTCVMFYIVIHVTNSINMLITYQLLYKYLHVLHVYVD